MMRHLLEGRTKKARLDRAFFDIEGNIPALVAVLPVLCGAQGMLGLDSDID